MAFHPPSIQTIYHNKQVNSPLAQIILLTIVIVLFSWFILTPKLTAVQALHAELKTNKTQLAAVEGEAGA